MQLYNIYGYNKMYTINIMFYNMLKHQQQKKIKNNSNNLIIKYIDIIFYK